MGDRREFQLRLEELMGGKGKVYYQPPSNSKITYPCVFYSLYRIDTRYADNIVYRHKKAYTVTYVDTNPDAAFPDRYLLEQPMTHFDRKFTSDNLHHWVFTTYY